MSVKDVAKAVGMHRSTLYRWIKADKVDVWRPHQRGTMVKLEQVQRVARADWREWRACGGAA
jgi:excisionase family DNA binding protein